MTKGRGATMEQPTRAQVLKLSNDIQKLILSDKMQKALVEASGEPELLKRAKADPRAFFEKRGVSLPKSYTLRLSGTVTICVTVCGTVAGVRVCVQVCGTIRF
jgi:hypothetical protein